MTKEEKLHIVEMAHALEVISDGVFKSLMENIDDDFITDKSLQGLRNLYEARELLDIDIQKVTKAINGIKIKKCSIDKHEILSLNGKHKVLVHVKNGRTFQVGGINSLEESLLCSLVLNAEKSSADNEVLNVDEEYVKGLYLTEKRIRLFGFEMNDLKKRQDQILKWCEKCNHQRQFQ